MGMFSTLIVDGKEIQFKTGYDNCDVFYIGDAVPFEIIADRAGEVKFADGVYDDNECEFWVVIKGHRIRDVVPMKADKSGYAEIMARYEIPHEYPREWWTEAAWEEKRKLVEKVEQQNQARMEAYRKATGRDPEAGEESFNFYIWCKMREPSFGALIFDKAKVDPKTGFKQT